MRPIQTLALVAPLAAFLAAASAGTLAGPAIAQDSGTAAVAMDVVVEAEGDALVIEALPGSGLPGPWPATDFSLDDFKWQSRVLVVFADTPRDPNFLRQIELLADRLSPLAERDVVVLTDADPAARGAIRTSLRPRGFAAVLVDKDGRVIARRPAPWDLREIQRAIDSTPLRLQELREMREAIDPIRGGR